ncbi:hypothetical protein GCK32_016602 [Trichostrongylus colubriformis]|uniref:Cytochrome P450 n=1 Tax=Trichostrongylus colubriformis TaxID=6319 RepID=A0AAN8IGF0_TRICO
MIFLTILLLLIGYAFLRTWLTRRSLPPGPIPIPLIGNMHQLAYKIMVEKKDFAESMRDFVNKYGNVHTFWFGPVATVQICDYPNAAEALIKHGSAFVNRALPFLFESSRGGRGLMASTDSFWTEQRRFSLHTLRNFGLGRNLIEERIMYELDFTFKTYDVLINRWTVGFPPLRRRAEELLKPQNDLLDFLANQVERRSVG